MKSAAQLEKEVLSLPAEERAHRTLDPEGVALALERDAEIEAE